jgi:hypothetical protein
MARLASIVVLAMLPLPAFAAGGGWEEMPWQYQIYVGLSLYLVVGVPAAGVGYLLGSFLRLSTSILVLAILTLAAIAWLGIIRGPEYAVGFAALPFVMLLFFGPAIYLGWRFGHRDAIQHAARKSVPANGN